MGLAGKLDPFLPNECHNDVNFSCYAAQSVSTQNSILQPLLHVQWTLTYPDLDYPAARIT